MAFFQSEPELGNQYDADRVLRSYLARHLPPEVHAQVEPELRDLGALTGGPLYRRALEERLDEPVLRQWDAWGKRVDRIELTPLWRDMHRLAAERGMVSTAYERRHGALSRLHQFALVYLFEPAAAIFTCPLAMTDGAARTLIAGNSTRLSERALPRLLARDPAQMWTSGQWMTERTGGSDVGTSETVAIRDQAAGAGAHRLFGTKFFTSATTSEMALTLARPEGNGPGGRGLALFYVELRNPDGSLNGIAINRLKDKLGTRALPTAELSLEGALALPVSGLDNGVKAIAPMLTITRTWNAVCAAGGMRRAVALARDYAQRRSAFGAPLNQKPLHVDTLATIAAETEAAFMLVFRVAQLLGRDETGGSAALNEDEAQLLRLLVPLAKLTTGKQAVAVASEALEAFGGQGYMEDTGLPRLLRDAQVLPIWEGTTNVLSLDVLRALAHGAGLGPVEREVARCLEGAQGPLREAADVAVRAVLHAKAWLQQAALQSGAAVEAGARRFGLTLGRACELALLVEHATWALPRGDAAPAAAARVFSRSAIDLVRDDASADDASIIA